MAQLLAPYNNSMRLGQGFNSYTQQICLDHAVLPDPEQADESSTETITLSRRAPDNSNLPQASQLTDSSAEQPSDNYDLAESSASEEQARPDETVQERSRRLAAAKKEAADRAAVAKRDAETAKQKDEVMGDDTPTTVEVPPWVKPQIVTYSSRFVDKLSDVTDAMNISGSLSIKTATVGGKASGSYVDSDKFKSSDINFHLQVKVTNQVIHPKNYTKFNKIDKVSASAFPEVYGDTFISGWEEGGELNAIISMKVMDKSKIFEVKAHLEAELNTPSIAGKVEGEFGMTNNKLSKETEITMAINWSGGGSIKDPSEEWSIGAIKKAASAFPDLVAITPQRTYAILTKYTALESFQRAKTGYSPLDYENAGVYTNALLDFYMDYKAMWKAISLATYELKGNRATIEMAQPAEDMYEIARTRSLPPVESQRKAIEGNESQQGLPADAVSNVPKPSVGTGADDDVTIFKVFTPSFAGLIQARKVCRFEMVKIVQEVDHVAKDPSLSLDSARDEYFLHPLVFEQLLPVVRSLSPENAALGVRDPSAALLLGYNRPQPVDTSLPPVAKLSAKIKDHDLRLQESVARLGHKAEDYRMQGCAGAITTVHSQAEFFNDLERLDATFRPTKLLVWTTDKLVTGLQMEYAKEETITHGACQGAATHELAFASNGAEIVCEISVKEGQVAEDGGWAISSVGFATSAFNTLTTSTSSEVGTLSKWLQPDNRKWSLRGFFGFAYKGALVSLGIVWGKDGFVPMPAASAGIPLCRSLLGLTPTLQTSIKAHASFAGKFILGESVSTNPVAGSGNMFNALETIGVNWTISNIAFASQKNKLTGLKVTYANGKVLNHGAYSAESQIWNCDVTADLVMVKMTAGKVTGDDAAYVDTIEFVRTDEEGQVPAWPFNLGTLRYLGEGETRVLEESQSVVIESAPKTGSAKWSIRGFFGETSDAKGGIITRLGAIWGRG